jgi:KUP system potassium uptake protein
LAQSWLYGLSCSAVLGLLHIADDIYIFKALSPHYAIELLTTYPKGFWILGAVFLCTTGAEALIF